MKMLPETAELQLGIRGPRTRGRCQAGAWRSQVRTALCALLLVTSTGGRAADVDAPPLIQHFAADVMHANDADGRAFGIIDKPQAAIWVYDGQGKLLARSPVLVGQARGDVAPPDIGTRPLSKVRPHEKITASGRYMTEAGRNTNGEDIVWLDYDAALSMHRVRHVPGENRPARLATPDVADNRISYGCVNVPPDFYDRQIKPLFSNRPGVVYVLPEGKLVSQVFPFATDAHRWAR